MTSPFEALDVFSCPLDGLRQIEASAGTGKTWNICGLYLRLLLERRLDVQHILVVTFTNAATAELRERIRQRLLDTLAGLDPARAAAMGGGDDFVPRLLARVRAASDDADTALAARLELALATFDEASIFTIHGFCQRALADTPFAAQMPLALELVRDDRPWIAEATNDFWRRHVAVDTLDPLLADHLIERKDTPEHFAALLERHLAKPTARAIWPEFPPDDTTLQAEWADTHAAARATWQRERADIVALLDAALPALSAVSYKPGALAAAAAGWDALLSAPEATAAREPAGARLDLLTPARLTKATKKGQVTPAHPFFELAGRLLECRARERDRQARRRLALLRSLLDEAGQAQRAAKRQQRVIAFNDMLSNLHARLHDGQAPWLAQALRERFPAALVDEFQDTDPLQYAIFHAVYGASDAPLFLVGDPKQAIYSFRNADLHTYLAAGAQARARYSLAENQRSTGALIDASNRLFGLNPRAFLLEGLLYQPVRLGRKPRPPFADRSGGDGAALQVWALPDDPGTGQPMRKRDADAAVAAATAGEIARLLAAARRGDVTLGADPRPLAAGDIAVLVRSNAQGARMRQALAAAGVGSVELSQASVFDSAEAEDLDRVLSAMLEPARERRLKAALATEAMGADAATLSTLGEDEARLLALVQRFAAYRDLWLARGIGFMLRQWLAGEGVTARLLARADGERRLTNLLHLSELLQEAAQTFPAPDALLHWFQSRRRDPGIDDATQLRLESDQDLVQIVTIHKSKGLEYPVVFCPYLWSGAAPPGDGLDGVAYHDALGQLVIDYGHEFLDEATRDEIKARRRLEDAAESLRLTYVALTRAVQRCVLVAGCYGIPTAKGIQTTTSTHALLNWLVAGAGLSPADWFEHALTVDDIRGAWQSLADDSDGSISLVPMPLAPMAPLAPAHGAVDHLAARPAPDTLPSGWWIGSFSAFAHGARHEDAGQDHDLRAAAAQADDPTRMATALTDDDPLGLPRGAVAGEVIHQVFEDVAFDDDAGWPAAAAAGARRLAALDLGDAAADSDDPARRLRRLLRDVLDTPIDVGTPTPLRLATLTRPRRLAELEFHLPARRLDSAALEAALSHGGYTMPRLAPTTLRGFLKGYIDLVFEHDGRYFVADWKSNHLGDTPADYGPRPVALAMREHAYHLQALLYLVALDRHLRRRMRGYDPAEHLGGSLYLFVRGVRPDWRNRDGSPCGVHFDRPDEQTIARLSALFDEAEVDS